jgi:DNA-binding NarL/FixJ family response regulator
VVDEARDPSGRSTLLAASVEIMLAAGDGDAAHAAADELEGIAAQLDAPLLQAMADQTRGTVRLAGGDARGALDSLRAAWSTWHDVRAPYEEARVRALIGAACRVLGDDDAAEMELDAARSVFERLGAAPELARLAPSAAAPPAALPDGLTAREAEVLALVASGRTNHEIAQVLIVSDHTVRRHLQNVFSKIGVSSRAGATAYAFTHGLV